MSCATTRPGSCCPAKGACFGGTVDPGESAEAAIRRELKEELEFAARAIAPVTEMLIDLPMAKPRRDRMSFFAVPVEDSDIAAMVQHEGAGKRLFGVEELAAEQRVAPWDLAVVLMHARRRALFGG